MQVSSVAENVGVGVHFNAFVPWQNKVQFWSQDSGWQAQHFPQNLKPYTAASAYFTSGF